MQVVQWMCWADSEILPASCTWVFPCMGIMQVRNGVQMLYTWHSEGPTFLRLDGVWLWTVQGTVKASIVDPDSTYRPDADPGPDPDVSLKKPYHIPYI